MKKNLLSLLMLLTSAFSFAQGIPDPLGEEASTSIGFIKNVGQVINTSNSAMSGIYFQSIHSFPNSYYFNDKVSFVYPQLAQDTADRDTLSRLDMTWKWSDVGNNVQPTAFEATEEQVNFYLAHCDSGCDELTKYKGLLYENIYPNIDLRIYSNNAWIKYYFIIKPGGSPNDIALNFDGQTALELNMGFLFVSIGDNTVVIPPGIAYEYDALSTTLLPWQPNFILNTPSDVNFATGTYNTAKTLVYELSGPAKSSADLKNTQWSTPFGGTGNDAFLDVVLSSSGEPHAVGWSTSTNYPTTKGVSQTSNAGSYDIVLTSFNTDLSLKWSTFYGGSKEDGYFSSAKFGASMDNSNNLLIFAPTTSTNIPLKQANTGSSTDYFDNVNDVDVANTNPGKDHILAKFNTSGQLVWGTFFGGDDCKSCPFDNGDIIVDQTNNDIYVAGSDALLPTQSSTGAYNITGTKGAYIAKFNASLEKQWCTYFAPDDAPDISSLELDKQGRLLITGVIGEGNSTTNGFNLVTPSGYYTQSFGGGSYDQFVTRFNTNLSINWASYIGGNGFDRGNTIITTEDGKIVILGTTNFEDPNVANNFPINTTSVTNVFSQSTFGGSSTGLAFGDATICSFNSSGQLENSTYLGGEAGEPDNFALCANKGNNVFAGGSTTSANFPKPTTANVSSQLFVGTSGATPIPNDYLNDFYVFGLDKNFVSIWSANFGGGNLANYKANICYGSSVFYVGYTSQPRYFPVTNKGNTNAYMSNSSMAYDAVITRFDMAATALHVKENLANTKSVSIYPNPGENSVYITSNTKIHSINIYNYAGMLIKTYNYTLYNEKQELNISDLKTGYYILEVIDENDKRETLKLIKN